MLPSLVLIVSPPCSPALLHSLQGGGLSPTTYDVAPVSQEVSHCSPLCSRGSWLGRSRVEPVTPWQEQCTCVVSQCTHEFPRCTRTLTHVGTVFAGTGRGMGKFIQGLPVSPPSCRMTMVLSVEYNIAFVMCNG
jgi:hypothetical protein